MVSCICAQFHVYVHKVIVCKHWSENFVSLKMQFENVTFDMSPSHFKSLPFKNFHSFTLYNIKYNVFIIIRCKLIFV